MIAAGPAAKRPPHIWLAPDCVFFGLAGLEGFLSIARNMVPDCPRLVTDGRGPVKRRAVADTLVPPPQIRMSIAYGFPSAEFCSLPRGGGGLGWGRGGSAWPNRAVERTTPTPTLPQLGGGRRSKGIGSDLP